MNPLLHPTNWKDYSLVDSGNGKKLERLAISYLADLNHKHYGHLDFS